MLPRMFTTTSGAANAEPTTSMPPRARATVALFGSSSPSGDPEGFVDGAVDADQDVVPSSQDEMTEARYAILWFDLPLVRAASYISCICARTGTLYFMHLITLFAHQISSHYSYDLKMNAQIIG
jgi:hypothetical protein